MSGSTVMTERGRGGGDEESGHDHDGARAAVAIAKQRIRLRERVQHVNWAWYLVNMSTGGVAALLGQQPHTFTGLETIGKVVFIWDLVLFVVISALQTQRFVREPSLLPRSLRNPGEAMFFPAFLLSIATIIICSAQYGAPSTGVWLAVTLRVLFWIYVAAAIIVAVSQYTFLFTTDRVSLETMTPAWILPILPAMLCGTVASSVAPLQPPNQAMDILVAGVTFQGLGFWAALALNGTYFARLAQRGMPPPNMRPAMFIGVSPPAFTVYALIEMSQRAPVQATYFRHHPTAAESLQQMALAFGIFIWSLTLWFFGIGLLGVLMAVRHISSFSLVDDHLSQRWPNAGNDRHRPSIREQRDPVGRFDYDNSRCRCLR